MAFTLKKEKTKLEFSALPDKERIVMIKQIDTKKKRISTLSNVHCLITQ